jgi:predicted TIM-barrel fold metal-dependent hydrolase
MTQTALPPTPKVTEQVAPREAGAGRRARRSKVTVVDTDIHPAAMPADLGKRMDEPYRSRLKNYGHRVASPPMMYPRVRNGGFRLDSWPAGGIPGSSLEMVQEQLLDEYDVDHGVLIPLQSHSYGGADPEFGAAMCRALNEWTREEWLDREPRLKSSLCVPHEAPDLAVREIERYADDPRFVQVLIPTGGETSFGRRKYWPIYRACAEAGIPIAAHLGGLEQQRGPGWPSFYLEEHVWLGTSMIGFAISFICDGVLDEIPDLKVVMVEGGVSWGGPLMWAMDDAWSLLREDAPKVKRPPSEYLKEHFWFTTQPIEEPEDYQHLVYALEHMGMTDRIMFASDYPHWDFDSPSMALRPVPKSAQNLILGENACRLYGFPLEGQEPAGNGQG